jgi:hypothetical protein
MNGEPAQIAQRELPGKRVLIGLAWGLIQVAIVFVLLFAGGAHHGRLLSLTRPKARP